MATNKIVSSDYNITATNGNVNITTNLTNIVGSTLVLNTGNNFSNTYIEFVTPAKSRATPNSAAIRWNDNGVGPNLGRFEWSPDATLPANLVNWYGFVGTDSNGNLIAPNPTEGTQSLTSPAVIGFGDITVSGNATFNNPSATIYIEGQLIAQGNATFVNKQAVTVSNTRIYVANNVIQANLIDANGAGFIIGPPNGMPYGNSNIANNDGFVNFVYNYFSNIMTLDKALLVSNNVTSGNINAINNLNIANNAFIVGSITAANYYFSDGNTLVQATNSEILFAQNSNALGSTNFTWDNANANVNVAGNVNVNLNTVLYNSGLIVTSNNVVANNLRSLNNVVANGNVTTNNLTANLAIYTPLANVSQGNVVSANNLSNYYYYGDTGTNLTGGSNNYVQYNSNNRFAASSALQFNPVSNLLAVTGPVQASSFVFANGVTLSSGTPPGGTNYNFQYNQNQTFAGATTFNYDIGSGNVTAQGNVITQTKTLSLIGIGSSNIATPAVSSTFAVATNGAVSVALEKPQGNIVTTGATITTGAVYFVKFAFSGNSVITVGSTVQVTGPGSVAGYWPVIDSGLGYANLAYGATNPGTYTSANIILPINLYYSTTGTIWQPVAGITTAIPDATPAQIKYDSNTNIFYSVVGTSGSTGINLLRSTNGLTWTSSQYGITQFSIRDFTYDSSSNTYIIAGSDLQAGGTLGIAYNTGNATWGKGTLPVVITPATLRSVASDTNGRYVATDDRGAIYVSNTASITTWTTAGTASYATQQSGYPYSPLFYQASSNTFIWANNYVTSNSYLLQAFTYAPSNLATLYTANAYIQYVAVTPTQTLFASNLTPNTSVYVQYGNTFTYLANVPGNYTNFSLNTVTNQVLLADSNAQIGYAQLVTAGGGNVYSNNIIANTFTGVTSNTTTINTVNINVAGVANISNIGNLQVNGGNVGQFVGVNTSNVLTFIDRVSFANLNLGSNTATTAAINAQLPASLANNQQNGSMVFNTDTNANNTQPLYIYLNGSWRQMLVSQAL
jgi:hypothetical protein